MEVCFIVPCCILNTHPIQSQNKEGLIHGGSNCPRMGIFDEHICRSRLVWLVCEIVCLTHGAQFMEFRQAFCHSGHLGKVFDWSCYLNVSASVGPTNLSGLFRSVCLISKLGKLMILDGLWVGCMSKDCIGQKWHSEIDYGWVKSLVQWNYEPLCFEHCAPNLHNLLTELICSVRYMGWPNIHYHLNWKCSSFELLFLCSIQNLKRFRDD